mgnify:CR=1 FL=1
MCHEYEYGSIKTKSSFSQKNIRLEIEFPIKIIKENSVGNIDYFTISIPIRFGHILNIKEEIIDKIQMNQLRTDDLSNLDVKINVLQYDEENIVY